MSTYVIFYFGGTVEQNVFRTNAHTIEELKESFKE
jgi:hypothetical protein